MQTWKIWLILRWVIRQVEYQSNCPKNVFSINCDADNFNYILIT